MTSHELEVGQQDIQIKMRIVWGGAFYELFQYPIQINFFPTGLPGWGCCVQASNKRNTAAGEGPTSLYHMILRKLYEVRPNVEICFPGIYDWRSTSGR
jgi:hypothetical protein